MGYLAPAGHGFLELTVPWSTLTGSGSEPGSMSRLGAITPVQASYLACLAARDPEVDWRVIVAGTDGRAQAVGRVRRQPPRAGPRLSASASTSQCADHCHGDYQRANYQRANYQRAGQQSVGQQSVDQQRAGQCSLVKRVTVMITCDDLAAIPPTGHQADGPSLPPGLARVLAAARRAADRAVQKAAADTAATDGCAHTEATDAYRPPPRLREYITARDVTCRFPTCRRPAMRCDLDHTQPYDQGGRTCSCNLGAECRLHHKLKQHARWHLAQPAPGVFTWTTPAGRTYTTLPDSHVA